MSYVFGRYNGTGGRETSRHSVRSKLHGLLRFQVRYSVLLPRSSTSHLQNDQLRSDTLQREISQSGPRRPSVDDETDLNLEKHRNEEIGGRVLAAVQHDEHEADKAIWQRRLDHHRHHACVHIAMVGSKQRASAAAGPEKTGDDGECDEDVERHGH